MRTATVFTLFRNTEFYAVCKDRSDVGMKMLAASNRCESDCWSYHIEVVTKAQLETLLEEDLTDEQFATWPEKL